MIFKKFKITFLALIIMLSWSVEVFSQTGASPAASVPLPKDFKNSVLGAWGLMIPGLADGLCQEGYRYSENGTGQESSGNSQTQSQWKVAPAVDNAGFSAMTVRILQHNGQRDCGNRLPPVGTDLNFLVRVHPSRNWMEFCSSTPEQRSCVVLWRLVER